MEKNVEYAKIIEFNGLPGTGKSTIADCLSRIATEKGITVYDSYGRNSITSKLISPLLEISSYRYIPRLLSLGRLCELNKVRIGQILRFLSYVNCYREFEMEKRDSALLILDEGIVQSLVSIAYLESFKGKEKDLTELFTQLKKSGIKWYQVNCINEPKLSFDRIIGRGSNLGRFDQMKNEELINALKLQIESFDIVRDVTKKSGVIIDSLDIDTSLNPEKNAELIYKRII